DAVHQLAETDELPAHYAAVNHPDRTDNGPGERPAEHQRKRRQSGTAAQHKQRGMRQPHCAAHAKKTLAAAMVLATDRYQGAAAQAARDLEVPSVPSRIRHDEVFLRNEKI